MRRKEKSSVKKQWYIDNIEGDGRGTRGGVYEALQACPLRPAKCAAQVPI
jgi:hypothetical protein